MYPPISILSTYFAISILVHIYIYIRLGFGVRARGYFIGAIKGRYMEPKSLISLLRARNTYVILPDFEGFGIEAATMEHLRQHTIPPGPDCRVQQGLGGCGVAPWRFIGTCRNSKALSIVPLQHA